MIAGHFFVDEPHVVGKPMNALPIDGILIVESIYHFLDFIQINLSVSNQVFRIYLLVAENAIFDSQINCLYLSITRDV